MSQQIDRVVRARMMPGLVLLVCGSLAAAASAEDGTSRTVRADTPWIVTATTRLSKLAIEPGAQVGVADGYSLTMTVNGVGTTIAPGRYQGNVVLTPTKRLSLGASNGGPHDFRAAVLINDDRRVADQSVPAAVIGGHVDDRIATGIRIDSREENFNGVLVTGRSTYAVDHATIDMEGNGGNDFAGFGAAIMSAGEAELTVNHAHIRTHGVVRTALYIGGKSTMYVNDSDIEVASGTLPADYKFSIAPGQMKEVPYGMGLSGNVRATNLIDEATVYYNHSRFKSNGWGVLSSDGNGPTRMFVRDCSIETVGSGYGAYANGDAHDFFSNTRFNVADVGIIIGGNGWATLTDGSEIRSDKTGVFMHQGSGGSILTVEKKSRIVSKDTAVQIKGRGGDIIVDDGELQAGNGVLIQSMDNDDPVMAAMAAGGGGGPPGGAGGPPGGVPPGGAMPGAGSASFSPDVNATLRNTGLSGDILHALTKTADMTVTLQNASLIGAISTSQTRPASGRAPDRETFRTVGVVTNDLGPSATAHTLKVYLDWKSHWVVTRTSYLDGLVLPDGATLEAPAGQQLSLTVDGAVMPLKAGSYGGRIVLQVRPAG